MGGLFFILISYFLFFARLAVDPVVTNSYVSLMRLADYIKQNNISHSQLATDLEVSRVFVTQIVNGVRWPSYTTAKRIVEFTDGAVTIDELMSKEADQ